jgi:hypothetical protein
MEAFSLLATIIHAKMNSILVFQFGMSIKSPNGASSCFHAFCLGGFSFLESPRRFFLVEVIVVDE